MHRLLSLAVLALVLPACQATLGSEEIQPQKLEIERSHPLRVTVTATSSPSGMILGPRITAEDLGEAIRTCITSSELFLPATEGEAELQLHAEVLELTEGELSVDCEADVRVRWSLARPGCEAHWTKTIQTDYTAHVFNTDTSEDRVRVAIRRATRKNIREALECISRLEAPGGNDSRPSSSSPSE